MFDYPKNKFGSFFATDLNELFITHSLHTFAFSLAGLFIPIFLLAKGFSFMHVLFYILLQSALSLFSFYFFLKLSAKIGVKKSLGMGLFLMILQFLSLKQIDYFFLVFGQNTIIVLLVLIHVLSATSYWSAFHLGLATKASSKKAGVETSLFQSLSTVSSILAPLFGGLIIAGFSYQTLFAVTLFIVVLAMVPLFFINEIYDTSKIKMNQFIDFSSIGEGIPYFAEGFRHFLAAKLWPIFLYLIAINVKEIGFLYTVSSSLVVIFTVYAGRLHDKISYFKVMKFGAMLHSFTLATRVLLRNIFSIGFIQGLGGISYALLSTNFMADYLQSSKERGAIRTVYEREFYLDVGRVFLISLAAIIFVFTRDPITTLTILFIIGAFSPMVMLGVEKNKKMVTSQ